MKNIVFDLGGVLIDWNPRYLYRKIFSSTEEMDWFLNHICTSEWNSRQDAGRPFAVGQAELKAKYPRYSAQIDDYFLRWEEMLGGLIKGSVEILKELYDKGYRLYALSNWSAETFPIAQKKFDFLGLFDGIVLSGEEKMNKPEPEIYKRLLFRYQLQADNCIFTDDNQDNVSAAQTLGIDAILFTNPEQLHIELIKRGIL